jgi:hypothetical protein
MVTGAYDVEAQKGTIGNGFRATGSGTVTITTAAGNSEVLDVNDGELVPVQFRAITAIGGSVTKVRIHIPKVYGKPGRYGGGS